MFVLCVFLPFGHLIYMAPKDVPQFRNWKLSNGFPFPK